MDHGRRAELLVLAGVALVAVTFLVGFLTAPSLAVEGQGDRQTLVGSQSAEGGWHEGGAVFMLDGETETWREDSAVNYFDVTQLSDGRVLAAFSHVGYESDCGPYETPCAKTGYRIIDPEASGGPSVVEEWAFPIRTSSNSEVHDVERLSNGEFLLADMEHERLIAVRDGDITWQWNASSHYNAPADPTRTDWLHINDVDVINETHYLVSVRNANQILVVSRSDGVEEVINEDRGGPDDSCRGQLIEDADGDVRCGDPSVIDHQHNPQYLDSGAVLVADSDNDRAVELHENETTGRWEPVWAVDEVNNVGLHWPRDADRLANGNTLITDTFNSRVVEITPNGTAVWTAQLYNLPYESERLPEGELSGAQRYTPSGAVADPGGGGIPLLTTAVEAAQGQFPFLPFWFGEFHLVVVLVAVGLVIAGGIEAARELLERRRARSDESASE